MNNKKLVIPGILLGLFLAALESTVIATAMPTVVSTLGGLDIYSWVFSGYMLSSTITMPIWGRLSDLYGRRKLFFLGVLIFMLGSALCGFSRTMHQLIAFRFIQGVGAGAVMPLTFTIIGDLFSLEQRAKMQGLFSGVWGVASIVGPVLGGYIADHLSWRWVFYINIPFGTLSMFLIYFGLHEEKSKKTESVSLDYVGAFCFSIAVLFLLTGLSLIPTALNQAILLFLGSLILLAVYVWLERRSAHPLIPLKLFNVPIFASAQIAGIFSGMAMFGTLSYIPLFMQSALGSTATQAGRILLPFMLSWVLFSIVGGRLILTLGYRKIVIAGSLLLMFGFVLMTFLKENSTTAEVMLSVALQGAGMGFNMAPFLIAVQNAFPKELMGAVTSSTQFIRTIGGAIGVSVMGAALSYHLKTDSTHLLAQTNPSLKMLGAVLQHPDQIISPVTRSRIPEEVLNAAQRHMAGGLTRVFVVGLCFSVIAFLACLTVPGGSPRQHQWKEESETDPA